MVEVIPLQKTNQDQYKKQQQGKKNLELEREK